MQYNYLVELATLKPLTIAQVKTTLANIQGLPLRECRIEHLVFHKGQPIYTGNGVYIIKTSEEVIYVGNCFSRNFVERIPAHFDIRTSGWFHSLLKNILKKRDWPFDDKHLAKAARWVFENCSVVLINFTPKDYNKNAIGILEKCLIRTLNSYNTRGSRSVQFTTDMKLKQLLGL